MGSIHSKRNGSRPLNKINAEEGRVFWTIAPMRGFAAMMRANHGATRLISWNERNDARNVIGAAQVSKATG